MANHGDGTVSQIAAQTGRAERALRIGSGPSGLAAADGAVWVTEDGSGTLARIDAQTSVVDDTIHVGDAPSAVAADAGGVWVTDRLDSTLSKIDPARDVVEATYPLAGAPSGLAIAHETAWVGDEQSDSLLGFDTKTGAPSTLAAVGKASQTVAADGGLWLAIGTNAANHRGGTLREVARSATSTQSIPARAPPGTSSHPSTSA